MKFWSHKEFFKASSRSSYLGIFKGILLVFGTREFFKASCRSTTHIALRASCLLDLSVPCLFELLVFPDNAEKGKRSRRRRHKWSMGEKNHKCSSSCWRFAICSLEDVPKFFDYLTEDILTSLKKYPSLQSAWEATICLTTGHGLDSRS